MPVSAFTGGGITAFNVLEPCPPECSVRYVTLRAAADREPVFPEISARVRWCPSRNFPEIRLGGRFSLVQQYGAWRSHHRQRWDVSGVEKAVMAGKEFHASNVLLVSPQGEITTTLNVARRMGLPVVGWFMDDYFQTPEDKTALLELITLCRRVFVISAAMRDDFQNRSGVTATVLNNSVDFPLRRASCMSLNKPLKIVYAGAINSYYEKVLRFVVDELEVGSRSISLDIFTTSELPAWLPRCGRAVRVLLPLDPPSMRQHLQSYDATLLLSSFEESDRVIATTSQASKMADYVAAGRPVIAVGPEYAQNVRCVTENHLGISVTDKSQGAFCNAVQCLLDDSELRNLMGEAAFKYGLKHHERASNSRVLWDSLMIAASR